MCSVNLQIPQSPHGSAHKSSEAPGEKENLSGGTPLSQAPLKSGFCISTVIEKRLVASHQAKPPNSLVNAIFVP